MKRCSLGLTLLAVMVFAASGCACAAETSPQNREYQLKTAYLFHFAELAEWPTTGDITICSAIDNHLTRYLSVLDGRKIASQTVRVKLIDTIDSLAGCSIVYLDQNQSMTPQLAERGMNHHLLLVGDGEHFAEDGGMLQFALRDNKLKLLVNLPAVRAAGLKLSSKLLRMAEVLE